MGRNKASKNSSGKVHAALLQQASQKSETFNKNNMLRITIRAFIAGIRLA
jgi:hypothetical protein